MRTISRFEADLMQILHCLLERAPLSRTVPLLVRTAKRPACLSRDCIELIQQALASGVVSMLATSGGWQRERYLRGDGTSDLEVVDGRLWNRSKPEELGLEFSVNAVDFLMWLTASLPSKPWKPSKSRQPTTGDLLLIYLAYRRFRDTPVTDSWCKRPLFRTHGLCSLVFADDFVDHDMVPNPDFSPWVTGAGVSILESTQNELANRWVAMERAKSQIITPARMQIFGKIQGAVITSFLDAINAVKRRDLGRFLLVAANRILSGAPSVKDWTGALNVQDMRIASRTSFYESSFSLLRQLERLSQWEQESRNTGYFDDNYAASQLWLSDWERWELQVHCETASKIIRQADPLGNSATGNTANE